MWNWAEFASQLAASIVGGGIAALIAFVLFRAEARARRADRARDEQRELQNNRAVAVAGIIGAMKERMESTGSFNPFSTATSLQEAITKLLLDGSEDSFTVYRFTMDRFHELDSLATPTDQRANRLLHNLVQSMLIAWVREEPGAIENMRAKVHST